MSTEREPDSIPLVPLRPVRAAGAPEVEASARSTSSRWIRPRSVTGVLDLAAGLLRSRFGLVVGGCLCLWLPVRVLHPFFGAHHYFKGMFAAPELTGPYFISVFGLGLLGFGAQILAQGYVTLALFGALQDRTQGMLSMLGQTLRRGPALMLVAFVSAFATAIAAMFLVVPGLLLAWKISLVIPVMMAEEASIGRALDRSLFLTRGSFWRFLGVVLVGWLVSMLCSGLAGAADDPNIHRFVVEATGFSELAFDLALVPATSLGLALGLSVLTSVGFAYYLDCRARREGLDLELELEALETGELAPEAT